MRKYGLGCKILKLSFKSPIKTIEEDKNDIKNDYVQKYSHPLSPSPLLWLFTLLIRVTDAFKSLKCSSKHETH